MSIEQALIVQSQRPMVRTMLNALVETEVRKGCSPEIANSPVSLEPPFRPLWKEESRLETDGRPCWTIEEPTPIEDLMRLQVWISPEYTFDWVHTERFIKQLQFVTNRVGFEVVGNRSNIAIGFLIHHQDFPLLSAAFQGEFDLCELAQKEKDLIEGFENIVWQNIVFRDYFPPPPYSHLLTRPPEFQKSPLIPLITALSTLETSVFGIFQAVFQPVAPNRNYHRNVELLLDIEYLAKLQNEMSFSQKYLQQSPSGDLHHMAGDAESKAHNDKPFNAAALRIAVVGGDERSNRLLNGLSSFMGLFQHGGRPMGYLTEKCYGEILSAGQIQDMFKRGLTYRPGMIVNSQELSGLIHIPALPADDHRLRPMPRLEMLSAVRNPQLAEGTWVGNCNYAGKSQKVCIPKVTRKKHCHIVGASGSGKTTAMEQMILEDMSRGEGVAVLDPHGDMIDRLLCLIPERDVSRVVYMNFAHPYYIPLWNPLEANPGQNISRTTNDLVAAIKSFVDDGGWGHRTEHIFRVFIWCLLHLQGSTFLDISNLLRNKSKQNDILVRKILKIIENPTVRQFWEHDYKAYGKNEFGPPINKLSKLLISGPVSLMLSQPENRFHFRKMMDQGTILFVDLSNIGVTLQQVLGSFLLSLLHLTALSRRDTPIEDRKPYHVFCDEAPNFITTDSSIEKMIVETRKYEVSLSLAHQYLSQLSTKKRDALSGVGTSIIFKVNKSDAEYYAKNLQGKVKPEDLTDLAVGESFFRVDTDAGTEIMKMETLKPLEIPKQNFREHIIESSYKSYYRPAPEIKKWLRRAGDRWLEPHAPLVQQPPRKLGNKVEDFEYEELF